MKTENAQKFTIELLLFANLLLYFFGLEMWIISKI